MTSARCYVVFVGAMLGGCSFARTDVLPMSGRAFVAIPATGGGEVAVRVYGFHSTNKIVSQHFADAPRTLAVRPGTYILDVDCFRPGAYAIVDGSFDFEVAFEADTAYTLDCSPLPADGEGNHFSLMPSTNRALTE
jgi:hypothetical protein